MRYILLLGFMLLSTVLLADKPKRYKEKLKNSIQFSSPIPYNNVLQNDTLTFEILLTADRKMNSYRMHLEKGGLSKLNCEEYFSSSINELFTSEEISCSKKQEVLYFKLKVNNNAIPGNYKFHIYMTDTTGNILHACHHFYVERK
ncbi:hypothetical protein JCM15579A_21930 [Marinifilum fragile]